MLSLASILPECCFPLRALKLRELLAICRLPNIASENISQVAIAYTGLSVSASPKYVAGLLGARENRVAMWGTFIACHGVSTTRAGGGRMNYARFFCLVIASESVLCAPTLLGLGESISLVCSVLCLLVENINDCASVLCGGSSDRLSESFGLILDSISRPPSS